MNSRNQSLDVLRFLAILLVLLDHYDYLPGTASGWIGVDLFFVLFWVSDLRTIVFSLVFPYSRGSHSCARLYCIPDFSSVKNLCSLWFMLLKVHSDLPARLY